MSRPPELTRTDTLLPYTTLFRPAEEPATTVLGHALQLRRIGVAQVEADHVQPEIDPRLPGRPHRFARIATAGLQPVGDKHDAGRLLRLPQLLDRLLHRCRERRHADRVETFDLLDHGRSEEHTSELQSLMRISYAVFCLNNK